MASYGYTFTSGDTLTPTKLNNARTVSEIVNADIKSDAAIALTKLASVTAGQVVIGNASNVATATALTGDVTVTSGGVTAIAAGAVVTADLADGAVTSAKIADGTIVNADISASAAIDKTKISGTAITAADSGTVTSAMIADGTIVNADISASAAIVDTKLATIATAGKVSNSATTATSSNTANTIVLRDASGNFSAASISGNVTGSSGSCTGNAATATKLSSAKTFAITGDVTGSASSDLTTGPSIAATIANDAVTFAKMQNSDAAGLSVVGRSAASAGDFAEITAATDGHVVRRSGSTVGFGTVATSGIADAAVTAPKLSGAQTGSAPIYGVRAWVNFNGTRNATDTGASTNGANVFVKASGNVTSVLKNSTGDYTITFTTALPDANYAVSALTTSDTTTDASMHVVVKGATTTGASNKTTTSLTILCGTTYSQTAVFDDMADVSVMVLR